MVPVLSVQIIVALPKVSTVLIFYNNSSFISLQDPKAIKVVKATEFLEGYMANVSPFNKLFNRSRVRQNRQPKPTENDNAYYRHHFTNFSICICSGVASL
jgi:hypothetical protein